MTSELRRKLERLFGEDLFPEIFNLLVNSARDGSFVIHGSPKRPHLVIPTVGLPLAPLERRQLWFVASTGGAQDITANPQIPPGSFIGQELMLVGTSDIDVVSFKHGNGIVANGDIELLDGQTCLLIYTGSVWSESSRR